MTKRVWLFVIGAVLGSIIMYFFVMKDRNIYLGPEAVIITKIKENKPRVSEKAHCLMECLGVTGSDIKELIENADVDFGASDVHGKPCKSYIIHNELKNAKLTDVTFQFCDTLITLSEIETSNKSDCNCN
jgi:hypothetical protein